jgi:Autographiviridae RNA polymerase
LLKEIFPLDALSKSLKATLERHGKRRRQQAKMAYSQRDEGRIALDELLPALAEFIGGPDRPRLPQGLDRIVGQLPPATVALAALSALMDFVATEDGLLAADERREKPLYRVRYDMADALHRAYWTWMLERDRTNYDPRRAIAKHGRRKALHESGYRQGNWTNKQRIRAGNWLLRCCLIAQPDIFGHRSGVPFVRAGCTDYVTQLCADLALRRHPMFLPSNQPLHPWSGWRTGGYWNRDTEISTTFVRRCNPATKAAVEEAFRRGTMKEHVAAVNRLQDVAWSINAKMLPVIRSFAGEDRKKLKDGVRRHLGLKGLTPDGGGVGKAIPALQVLVDIKAAEQAKGAPFWVPCNSDFRGRVYPIPHFNYGREDHVRSLFLFANGLEMTPEGLEMLAIHTANCGDFNDEEGRRISKRSFGERIAWVKNNRALIERIATDPVGTVDEWRGADSPFLFVASCMELAEAWRDPKNFKTRMPVAFDATCSGIQHYVLMMRDEVTAPKVNLIDEMSSTLAALAAKYPSPSERRKAAQAADSTMRSRVPQDIYSDIRDEVVKAIKAERNNHEPRFTKPKAGKEPKPLKSRGELARFWLADDLLSDERNGRKLVKTPAMTYGYGATVGGMTDQVRKVWKDWGNDPEAMREEATYLAGHIYGASKKVLPGPTKAMDFIRQIAGLLAKHNLTFTWQPPTGFPWRNEYRLTDKKKTERVDLPFDNVRGKSSRPKISVADGWGEINFKKSKNAAAPNVVHALDACHLVRTVNAAAAEGITSVATVHDSFAALAPQAQRFRQIIGVQLMLLYLSGKETVPSDTEDVVKVVLKETRVLENLLAAALTPLRGSLNLWAVQDAEFSFS